MHMIGRQMYTSTRMYPILASLLLQLHRSDVSDTIARPVHKKNLVRLVEAFAAHDMLRAQANLVILPGLRSGFKQGEKEHREVLLDLVDAIDRNALHGSVAWPRGTWRACTSWRGERAGFSSIRR